MNRFRLAVGRNQLVDFGVQDAKWVILLRASREHGQQQNLHVWKARLEFPKNHADSPSRVLRRILVMSRIIRTDHENGELRRQAIHFAVLEPPQDVFRAVAAKAHIDGLPGGIILRPELFARTFPAVRDRVANHEQIDIALLGPLNYRFVSWHPPLDRIRCGLNRGLDGPDGFLVRYAVLGETRGAFGE